jgi:fructose-1,6-bisphosphatase/inositol monophosphatase family enzyme
LLDNLNRPEVSTVLKRKKNSDYSIKVNVVAERFILESISAAGLEGTVLAEEGGRI